MKPNISIITCAALVLTTGSALAQAPAPPFITTSFGARFLAPGAITSLTFAITTTDVLFGVAFTDTLPDGLVVASPDGLTGSCGLGGTITAANRTIALAGALMRANSSCTFSVNVRGVLSGAQTNIVTVIDASSGVVGNTSDAIIVVAPFVPPVLTEAFGAASVDVNTTTSLTFTLTNPNPTIPLTGIFFNDPLPTGLIVAPVAVVNACGGAVNVIGSVISLAGVTLPPSGVCTVVMTVVAVGAGPQTNTTGPVVSFESTAGSPATAVIMILPSSPPFLAPVLTKSFNPAVIWGNQSTTLTFVLSNPNPKIALTGINFTDALPAGMGVATPSGLVNGCGGVLTAADGSTSLSLTDVTLAGAATCTATVNIKTSVSGTMINTTSPVNSINGATGTPATASLTLLDIPVEVDPAIPPDALQVRYLANFNIGDSVINFTNTGPLTLPSGLDKTGNICVNVYVFDANEEILSCCSCLVTPNGLMSYSAKADLYTLFTMGVPTSMTVKLLATTPLGLRNDGTGGTCNASSPSATPAAPGVAGSLVPGLRAWGTTLHALPTTPVTYALTESEFLQVPVGPGELKKLTLFCGFIQANGSGFGICRSCRLGGL